MPVFPITIFVDNVQATREAVEEWHDLHVTPYCLTRLRLAEQSRGSGKSPFRKTYCVDCTSVVDTTTTHQWRTHRCRSGPLIACIYFTQDGYIASTIETLQFIKGLVNEGAAYNELWKILSWHAIRLLQTNCVEEDLILDLCSLDIMHGDSKESVPAHILSSLRLYGTDAPLRAIPHVYIYLNKEAEMMKSIQDWYDLLISNAVAQDPGQVPFFQASVIRLREQVVSLGRVAYHCMKCDDTMLYPKWNGHRCRAAVSVTFQVHYASLDGSSAEARQVLSSLKKHSVGSLATRTMWKVVTEHCVSLFEYGHIPLVNMQDLLMSELLCPGVVPWQTLASIEDPQTT